MAQLSNVRIRKSNEVGESIDYTSSVLVDNSTGEFSMSFPEELLESFKALTKTDEFDPLMGQVPRIMFSRGKYRIISSTLQETKKVFDQAISDHLACEIERTLVIRYSFTNECKYYKRKDGIIDINGSDEEGEFFEKDYYNTEHSYVLGIKAEVCIKEHYKRKSVESVEYKYPFPDDLKKNKLKINKWGAKLNSFIRVSLSNKSTELPYTEETAKFFCEAMLGLCSLADKLTAVLEKPENVLKATGLSMLPSNTATKKK